MYVLVLLSISLPNSHRSHAVSNYNFATSDTTSYQMAGWWNQLRMKTYQAAAVSVVVVTAVAAVLLISAAPRVLLGAGILIGAAVVGVLIRPGTVGVLIRPGTVGVSVAVTAVAAIIMSVLGTTVGDMAVTLFLIVALGAWLTLWHEGTLEYYTVFCYVRKKFA